MKRRPWVEDVETSRLLGALVLLVALGVTVGIACRAIADWILG